MPQSNDVRVRRVGEETAVWYVVYGKRGREIPWDNVEEMCPTIAGREQDVDSVLDDLGSKARLIPDNVIEDIDYMLSQL